MKKKLLVLSILTLALTACGGGNTPSSEPSSSAAPSSEPSSSESSEPLPDTKDVTILCYLDYNHANQDSDAFYTAKWYFGVPFSKADIGLVDPTSADANYPEFTTFLGWSLQPIIDSEDQLFNWGEYVKARDGSGSYVNLYGIWVSK